MHHCAEAISPSRRGVSHRPLVGVRPFLSGRQDRREFSQGAALGKMSSYRQIAKSTTLIGGTQVINIFIGIIRTKVLAMLLGPSGVGVVSMYQSAVGLVGTLTGFGIGSAGVRQIAEAVGIGPAPSARRPLGP